MTCTQCRGKGWYTGTAPCGDPEQVQCEQCYGSGEVASARHPAFAAARRNCDDPFRACQIEAAAATCALAEHVGELAYQVERLVDMLDGPTGEAYIRTCNLEGR